MSDGRKYYCYCDSNCKFETMTKEQILAAIAQAVETGKVGECDTGFITKVKEINGGKCVTFWVGTQAQYNALAKKEENCMYIITDDTTSADLLQTVQQMAAECNAAAASAGEAAASASEAAAVVAGAKKIDIAAAVTFTIDAENSPATITDPVLRKRNVVYSPSAGVVFFDVLLQFGGTLAAGDTIVLNRAGTYPPAGQVAISCASTTTWGHFSAFMNADGTIKITAHESMDIGTGVCLSGWYFCNGE